MSAPPAYTPSTPPAGLRVPCSTDQPVPNESLIGSAPFVDLDGSPVYVASAIMGANAVHPCKVARGLVMVAYGGGEKHHKGRYDILPITEMMEWVDAQHGQIPKGRRPVEGGFEASGQHLFHALTFINEVQVPGKTGEHLRGANFGWGGGETVRQTCYKILCWR